MQVADKNMDDLLAQLKEEFEPVKQPKSNSERSQNSNVSKSPNSSQSQASMDKMLSDLRNELESGRGGGEARSSPSQTHSASNQVAAKDETTKRAQDKLIAAIEREYQKQAQQREQKLAAIKRQQEELLAQQERQARELIAAQQREEARKKRRQQALKQKAQEWLKKLNPQSEEGKWFEEFSYSYESKLTAAIDYLEAMRESGL
jgi:hypothetical protein